MDPQPPMTSPASPRKKKNVQRTLKGQRTLIPELQDPATIQEYRHCLGLEETAPAQFSCTYSLHLVESTKGQFFKRPSSLPDTRPVTPRMPASTLQQPSTEELQVILVS